MFRKSIPAILTIVFLWFLYHSRFFLFDDIFYLGDSFAIDMPLRVFLVESIKNGEIPLWNPYILSGVPFLVIASLGLLHPFTVLFAFIPAEIAMNINLVINNLLSAITMFAFVYVLDKNRKNALLSAIIYAFCGFSANAFMSVTVAQVLPLLPLSFILMLFFIRKKKFIYLFLTSAVLSMQFIFGFPFIVYLTAVALAIFYLLEAKVNFVLKLWHLVLLSIMAILLSSPLLLPQLELSSLSTRPLNDFAYATSSSLYPLNLPTVILPHFWGIPEIEFLANIHNRIYIGVIPLILILVVLLKRPPTARKSIVIIMLCGLFLSFGRYFPLYRLALWLPFLSVFREPEYFVLLYIFGASLLAGNGIDYLWFERKKLQLFIRKFRPLVVAGLIISFILLIAINFAPFPFWQMIAGDDYIDKIAKIKNLGLIHLSNWLFFFAILWFLSQTIIKAANKKKFYLLVVACVFIDLFVLNSVVIFYSKRADYQKISAFPSINRKLLQEKDYYRIHSVTALKPKNWNDFSRESYLSNLVFQNNRVFFPNRNMLIPISSVDGFTPLALKSYSSFLTGRTDLLVGVTGSDLDANSDKLTLSSAKYIYSQDSLPINSLYKLLEAKPGYFLYEKTYARPRVFLLDNNDNQTGLVQILNSSANTVKITTLSPQKSRLVLLDNYYPGWQATVDGTETEITLFETTFRQVEVPAGNHLITFEFKPKSFTTGLKITIGTLLVIFLWLRVKLFR